MEKTSQKQPTTLLLELSALIRSKLPYNRCTLVISFKSYLIFIYIIDQDGNFKMSYNIESRRLKRLIEFYAPFNKGEELKFMHYLKGEQEIYKCLETSPFQGITGDSVEERMLWFGANQVGVVNQLSTFTLLLYPFDSFGVKIHLFFSLVLLVAAIFTPYNSLSMPIIEPIFSLCSFSIAYILSLLPQLQMHLRLKPLSEFYLPAVNSTVWRDNKKITVASNQIVVGDIVELGQEDVIPADGWMIEGEVNVEEIISYEKKKGEKMTMKECINQYWVGEDETKKAKPTNIGVDLQPSPVLLGGSKVLNGGGKMIVLCVGKCSRQGEFAQMVQQSALRKKSQLLTKIDDASFSISKVQLLALIAQLALFFLKFLIHRFLSSDWMEIELVPLLNSIIIGISSLLISVTTSLIIGLTLIFAYTKLQLQLEHDIDVKRMIHCADIASINTLCYEKVIDENFFQVIKWWNGSFEEMKTGIEGHTDEVFQGRFQKSLQQYPRPPEQLGLNLQSYFPWDDHRIQIFMSELLSEFSASRAHRPIQLPSSPYKIQYVYGSVQKILPLCTHRMQKQSGQLLPISPSDKQQIDIMTKQQIFEDIYCVVSAYMEVDPEYPTFRDPKLKFVMLSIIFYEDKRDREEFEAVHSLKKQGIKVVMVTVNEHNNSISRAKQLGIIISGQASISLKGYDFNTIVGGIICNSCKKSLCTCAKNQPKIKNRDEFQRISKHLHLISQAQSIHKLSLVIGFNTINQNVCLMGTRQQDIPAMNHSQVSITVAGQSPDEFAQMASCITIPKNTLGLFRTLLHHSKLSYSFIKKYLQLVGVAVFTGFFMTFFTYLLVGGGIMRVIWVMWVCMVLCPLLGLVLVHDEEEPKLNKGEVLLGKSQNRFIQTQVWFQVLLLLAMVFFGHLFIPEEEDHIDTIIGSNWEAKYSSSDRSNIAWGVWSGLLTEQPVYSSTYEQYHIYSRHSTFIFNLYALLTIFNSLNCRRLEDNHFNIFMGFNIVNVLMFIFVMIVHVVALQFGGQFVGLYPGGLTFKQWAICIGGAMIGWLVCFLVKLLPKDDESEEGKKYWPNKSYNLAVMTVAAKDTLLEFEVDDDFHLRGKPKDQ